MNYTEPIPNWLVQARREQLHLAVERPDRLVTWAYATIDHIIAWLRIPRHTLIARTAERQALYAALLPQQSKSAQITEDCTTSIKDVVLREHAEDVFLQHSFDAADLLLHCLEILEDMKEPCASLAPLFDLPTDKLEESLGQHRSKRETALPWRGCTLAAAVVDCCPLPHKDLYDGSWLTEHPLVFLLAHYRSYWAAAV